MFSSDEGTGQNLHNSWPLISISGLHLKVCLVRKVFTDRMWHGDVHNIRSLLLKFQPHPLVMHHFHEEALGTESWRHKHYIQWEGNNTTIRESLAMPIQCHHYIRCGGNITTVAPRFYYPSYQRSSLSASKQNWPTVTCLSGVLRMNHLLLDTTAKTQRYVPWPLQDCGYTRRRLDFKWRADNNATFIRPSWGILCHTQAGPVTINRGASPIMVV
jgi:hypothetical protein